MSAPVATGALVFAKDLPRMARFYEQMLGMTVLHAESGHTVLGGNGIELVMHGIPAHIAAQIAIADPPQAREETPIKLFFRVPSLAQARTRAPALGGRLAPAAAEWAAHGFRACDGVDPEGNVLQFREPAP
jgi:predicted enzyme related to lactoylglutathione lyase